MSCSNCYNGCPEIVSDRCVKYTGVDVPVLGIKNGDSLSYVEQALIEFLTSTLDGTGIKIDIPSSIICNLVKKYLPTCGDLTVVDFITALIKAACDLQEQVDAVKADITTLNADYTIGCLTGVTASSDTHAIVQAIINKLCALDSSFSAFVLNVTTNYVKKSELCSLVNACIAASTPSGTTKYYERMVPFTVVEFYGDPAGKFDVTGVGIGEWEKIYICNGQNGTPDKRGRIPVGAINGVPGGGPLNPVVDPIVPGNPFYSLNSTAGTNTVTLTTNQIPAHVHANTINVTDPGHSHTVNYRLTQADQNEAGATGDIVATNGTKNSIFSTNTSATGLTNLNVTITNASVGLGQSHNNIPPVLACYYIMYIP